MTNKLQGKTALITGASEGVGEAVAKLFGKHRMRVGLIARSEEKLKIVAEKIEKKGGHALVLPADLRIREDIERVIAETKQKFGFVDFLINNAGIGFRGFWNDLSLESDLDTVSVNYTAPVILIRHLLPDMLKENKGQIININAIGGLYAAPYQGAYGASKCALVAYAESLAFELENSKVNISSIFPGPIDTGFLSKKNYATYKEAPDIVSAEYIAEKVMSLIEKPRERLFIGSIVKLLATKVAFFYPQFFRKIIEMKNTPPE